MKPAISLVVPVYNVEKYIPQALDSIFNQTFCSGIEIICVDDCSTDNSLDVLKDYKEKAKSHSNISDFKIIELKENKSQGYARNLALSESTGDYVMYLDPDDWYETDAFEKAYNQVVKNNNDFVCFDFYIYYDSINKRKVCNERSKPFSKVINSPKIRIRDVDANVVVDNYCWAAIYKRDFLVKNDIVFSETIRREDNPFVLKTFMASDSVSWITEPLYNYRRFFAQDEHRAEVKIARVNSIDQMFYNFKLVTDMLLDAKCENLVSSYVVYVINGCEQLFNTNNKYDSMLSKDLYFSKIKELFLFFQKNGLPKKYKRYCNYWFYKKILMSENLEKYQDITKIENLLGLIFRVEKEQTKTVKRTVVYILGIKFTKTTEKVELEPC